MELGTGIFLSAVILGLVALFIATKDRWKWKKILLIVTSVSIASGVLVAGSVWLSDWHEEAFPEAPVKVVSYYQIRLGMTKDEVSYLLGVPQNVFDNPDPKYWHSQRVIKIDEIPQDRAVGDYQDWHYQDHDYSPSLTVHFRPETGKVVGIGCTITKENFDCDKVFDLGSGSSESEVLHRLGKPNNENINGVTKTLNYADLNLKFYLQKRKVYSTFVSEGGR